MNEAMKKETKELVWLIVWKYSLVIGSAIVLGQLVEYWYQGGF